MFIGEDLWQCLFLKIFGFVSCLSLKICAAQPQQAGSLFVHLRHPANLLELFFGMFAAGAVKQHPTAG